ncbi:MAG: hypothetical protein V5A27_09515 [Halapricum sp.]
MREIASGIRRNEVTENASVWGALGLSTLVPVGAGQVEREYRRRFGTPRLGRMIDKLRTD